MKDRWSEEALTLIMPHRITCTSNAHCAALHEECCVLACTITRHCGEKSKPTSFKLGRVEAKWTIMNKAPLIF